MTDYGFDNSTGGWDGRNWSLTLGRLGGIRIRVHVLFPILIIVRLLYGYSEGVLPLRLIECGVLFLLVLLHEFGHCYGCRFVGGDADDILMWPLGGLAYVRPPHRPYETMITILAGPAVNVVVCLLLVPLLALEGLFSWSLLNPIAGLVVHATYFPMLLDATFRISYLLLLFNLLPIFPFDGGRILQAIVWSATGSYHRASSIAVVVGMVGAGLLAAVSLILVGNQGSHLLLLTGIAIFAFAECWRMHRRHEQLGELPENEFGYDFSQGYASLERSLPNPLKEKTKPGLRSRLREWLRRRREQREVLLEAELDRLLEKIHVSGMGSLSRSERKVLDQASRRRKRETQEPRTKRER